MESKRNSKKEGEKEWEKESTSWEPPSMSLYSMTSVFILLCSGLNPLLISDGAFSEAPSLNVKPHDPNSDSFKHEVKTGKDVYY